jgi:amino acid adenylation domain-containing protein
MHSLTGDGILDWLDNACAAHSAAAAIRWREAEVTYGELDRRANAIAADLSDRKSAVVGVYMQDRIGIICAMLGIFRAGCAFAPLDTTAPPDRVRDIVVEMTPDTIFTDNAFASDARALLERSGTAAALVVAETVSGRPFTRNKNAKTDADAVSYIYYTSGSTGRPKGIAGRMKSLSHFIKWEIDTFSIAPGERVSQFAAPTFDPFFRDVLTPLCAGGTVCIPPEPPGQLDADSLANWIEHERLNLVHCVPSVFASIIRTGLHPERFKSLRYVLLAGETLQVPLAKEWMSTFGERIKLVNLYGSTETTMVKFFHVVREQDLRLSYIPVGMPMPGARALVLDDRRNVCAPGVVGEIYVRTPYLTLGYYKNPEATREVFIQNPFSADPTDIVYRTGDLGRVLEDGTYQVLGRKDNQIKIHGVRVELGEIEHHLRSLPNLREAVVIPEERASGEVRLHAYVVVKNIDGADSKSLRAALKPRLPDYMLPATFTILETMPLTPNGKIDKRSLPLPNLAECRETYVAPSTPTEEIVASIWSNVLGVDRVGVNDNFFDLGGHSLLATQVISRVREACAIDVPVRSIFEFPTVATLATAIVEQQAESAGAEDLDRMLLEIDELIEQRGGEGGTHARP